MRKFINIIEAAMAFSPTSIMTENGGKVFTYADLASAQESLPEYVYHGTTAERWDYDGYEGPDNELYVTPNLEVATKYAREWVEDGSGNTAVVVRFKLADLMNHPSIKMKPDFEREESLKAIGDLADDADLDWRVSMLEYGACVALGFKNRDKALGTITPVN